MFLEFWMHFIGFPNILGDVGNKIPQLGSHRTEFGRACICSAQNLRKWIYLTWNMNKSLCERFLGEIRPWITFNSHKKPSPKIWFETEHFEILSFSSLGLRVPPLTSWDWNGSRAQISLIGGILQVYFLTIQGYEQNL